METCKKSKDYFDFTKLLLEPEEELDIKVHYKI